MGLTLRLGGVLDWQAADTDLAEWLDDVESWLRERFGHLLVGLVRGADPDGAPRLLARLHPAAPGLELAVLVVQNGGGPHVGVHATARTDVVGPGYHHFLCELLRDLAAARGIRWEPGKIEDPSGYFFTGDLDALERHLDALRRGAAESALSQDAPADWTGLGWARFSVGGAVHTALGPRDAAWLSDVAAGRRDGRDIVPWPEPGEDEQYATGRLGCLLWLEARLRAPQSQDEAATLAEMSRLAAFLVEAGQPVSEDLLADLGDLVEDRPLVPRCRDGYWRQPATLLLPGGFDVPLPAEAGVSWQDAASAMISLPGLTAWLSVLAGDDAAAVGEIEADPALCFTRDEIEGRAAIVEQVETDENGDTLRYRVLDGRARLGGHLLVASLCFEDEAGEDEARGLWAALGAR